MSDAERAAHELGPDYGPYVDRVHAVTRIHRFQKARWFFLGLATGCVLSLIIQVIA